MLNRAGKSARSARIGDLIEQLKSVNKCLMHMVKYLDVMIEHADQYLYDQDYCGIVRRMGYIFAETDIGKIKGAATRCVNLIYGQTYT